MALCLLALLLAARVGHGADAPGPTESQVKALCLLNFARYVDWPADAFAETNSPISIGVMRGDKFEETLRQAVAGKIVGGRPVVVVPVSGENDLAGCQILFVGASEKKRTAEILAQVKARPVLTVGETEEFTSQGGVIGFVIRNDKVRFGIDLDAARRARLQISSKLLSLADSVSGKR